MKIKKSELKQLIREIIKKETLNEVIISNSIDKDLKKLSFLINKAKTFKASGESGVIIEETISGKYMYIFNLNKFKKEAEKLEKEMIRYHGKDFRKADDEFYEDELIQKLIDSSYVWFELPK
jgi:hypothetical protein